jgi:hypothetical protein
MGGMRGTVVEGMGWKPVGRRMRVVVRSGRASRQIAGDNIQLAAQDRVANSEDYR